MYLQYVLHDNNLLPAFVCGQNPDMKETCTEHSAVNPIGHRPLWEEKFRGSNEGPRMAGNVAPLILHARSAGRLLTAEGGMLGYIRK